MMTSRSADASPGSGAAAPRRCAQCGARLSPADQWCGLCHTLVPSQRTEPPAIVTDPIVTDPITDPVDAGEQPPPLRRRPPAATAELAESAEPAESAGLAESSGSAGDSADSSKGELTPERIDELLAQLAAAETGPDARAHLGVLAGLQGRAGGLLLAGVVGLVLLAGGMLSLYVLGSLI